MSVFKKMHQVQSSLRSLAANAEGQTGAARYNYVSGAKLLGIIRPIMDKTGLLLTQEVLDIHNEPITYMTRNGEKTEMFTTLHIKFTWIDSEDGSTLENHFYANGMNAWDKGLGSALTYAERYYLMKTFHIATDEDDIDALVKDEAINTTSSAEASPRPKRSKASTAAPTAPQVGYKPLSDEVYWKIVGFYSKGVPAKSGEDYKTAWIKMTNADAGAILKFNSDVEGYCAANQLPVPGNRNNA